LFQKIDINGNRLISLNELDLQLRKTWQIDSDILKNSLLSLGFHFAKNYNFEQNKALIVQLDNNDLIKSN